MKRLNIIIVAEGAIDRSNTPITTDYIKNVSTECVTAATTTTTDYCPGVGFDSVAVFLECSVRHTVVW